MKVTKYTESDSDHDSGDESSGPGEIHANKEDIVDDLQYDLANLTACNYHTLMLNDASLESIIISESQRAAQLLYQR